METKTFENGFDSWYETFFEITTYIQREMDKSSPNCHVEIIVEMHGTGGLPRLAHVWTEEFEKMYAGREWDGDYYDTIEDFCHNKNYGHGGE